MTMPGQPTPDGAYVIGGGPDSWGQGKTQEQYLARITGGVKNAFTNAENVHNDRVIVPIEGAYAAIGTVEGHASDAVTTAEAAANAAAAAGEKADQAYDFASFWTVECVVASAAVVLGDNELLLGPVINVPDTHDAFVTDVHIALKTQPNGMTIYCHRWDDENTTSFHFATAVLTAANNRLNVNALDYQVYDKERFFYTVESVTGTDAPQVLQIAVSGVYTPKTP